MLNISSGKFHGRKLSLPPSGITRPISQKVRAAIFNSIGDKIIGTKFLDLYAGSGAMAIEALSRGAKSATCVENSPKVTKIITQNIKSLEISDQISVVKQPVEKYLISQISESFDVVFADPPYEMTDFTAFHGISQFLKSGGMFVLSCSSKTTVPDGLGDLNLVKPKLYGDTQIVFFQLKK